LKTKKALTRRLRNIRYETSPPGLLSHRCGTPLCLYRSVAAVKHAEP